MKNNSKMEYNGMFVFMVLLILLSVSNNFKNKEHFNTVLTPKTFEGSYVPETDTETDITFSLNNTDYLTLSNLKDSSSKILLLNNMRFTITEVPVAVAPAPGTVIEGVAGAVEVAGVVAAGVVAPAAGVVAPAPRGDAAGEGAADPNPPAVSGYHKTEDGKCYAKPGHEHECKVDDGGADTQCDATTCSQFCNNPQVGWDCGVNCGGSQIGWDYTGDNSIADFGGMKRCCNCRTCKDKTNTPDNPDAKKCTVYSKPYTIKKIEHISGLNFKITPNQTLKANNLFTYNGSKITITLEYNYVTLVLKIHILNKNRAQIDITAEDELKTLIAKSSNTLTENVEILSINSIEAFDNSNESVVTVKLHKRNDISVEQIIQKIRASQGDFSIGEIEDITTTTFFTSQRLEGLGIGMGSLTGLILLGGLGYFIYKKYTHRRL